MLRIAFSLLILALNLSSNEFIVKFNSPESANSFAKQNKSLNSMKVYNHSFGTFGVISRESVNKSFGSLKALKANKSVMTDIEYIEPNYKIQVDTQKDSIEMNDARFEDQWGLKNTGRNSGGWFSRGREGEDINALNAWTLQRGSREVIVAVIDTGVNYLHEDLKANIWKNDLEVVNGKDDDGNGLIDDVYGYDFANDSADPMDDHGHGTHCAGVIGAVHDNNGIAGVMSNVKIMSLKFLSASGSGTLEGAIGAINYAINKGAHVMNNSWGGGPFSQALKDAIIAAEEKGIVFVAAAGNERNDNDKKPTYPATYDVSNVISVGAMTGKGQRAGFSNFGEKSVHVFAPGNKILSTVRGNRYQEMSGTSMAAPHVAGVVGLMLSQYPNMTPLEIREKLISTSKDNGELNKLSISNGRVDAFNALR